MNVDAVINCSWVQWSRSWACRPCLSKEYCPWPGRSRLFFSSCGHVPMLMFFCPNVSMCRRVPLYRLCWVHCVYESMRVWEYESMRVWEYESMKVCVSFAMGKETFAFDRLSNGSFVLSFYLTRVSFGYCGRFTIAEIVSFTLSVSIVCIWILTGHWLLMDAMGMGLCVAFIAFVRLPSLKVSTLLLMGLLIYDVFWVFFSSYIFNSNVMVRVATRPADNPVGIVVKKLHMNSQSFNFGSNAASSMGSKLMMNIDPPSKLSLPGKLIFPSMNNSGHFSMLGLGDVVMPGLLLCFVLRYDAYKRTQLSSAEAGVPPPNNLNRISYFHCSLIGYFFGLLTATVSSEIFKAAQPALLYLVPFTLVPLLTMAYLKGDLRRMWSEPFISSGVPKHLEV